MGKRRQEEALGQRIRRLRLAKGLSQRELARPGVSSAYIARIEAGYRRVSLKALRILAEPLGVTPEYLETGQAIPPEALRELRLADAELELQLGTNLERAASALRGELKRKPLRPPLRARAHAALGLLAARQGDHGEAVKQLQLAIESGQLAPEQHPDAYETLAREYLTSGRALAAVNLLEHALAQAEQRLPADPALPVRLGTQLALAHTALGATDQARLALATATAAAAETPGAEKPGPHARTRVYWTTALAAWHDDDPDTALTFIRRAIGLLEARQDDLQHARAHLLAARLLNLDGDHEQAAKHLDRAATILTLAAEPTDLGLLHAQAATIAAAKNEPERALALAAEAVALLGDDPGHRSSGWHALALAHDAAGDPEQAERNYGLALTDLKHNAHWREAAQVARHWSALYKKLGRLDDAYKLMDEAMLLAVRTIANTTARARDAR